MLTAVRQLAAADFIGLVSWITEDVVTLDEADPPLRAPVTFRVPPGWKERESVAVVDDDTPRRLMPSALLHTLNCAPAAVCLVHASATADGAPQASILLVWQHRADIPASIRRDPAFLQHLLVGRVPQERLGALPATAARLDTIMAHVPQGIIFVDYVRGDALINAAAASQLRVPSGILTREELSAAMVQLFARVKNSEFVETEARRIAADPDARIDDWSWELDGPEGVTLRVMSAPMMNAEGGGRLWTFDDVSHERALLRQLARHRAFEEKLRQVQKLELVGRLAASVAHDFNNLLTIIAGSAEMLEDAPLDAERRTDLRNIGHATDRARRLTRQLLTFTRQQVEQSEAFELDERLHSTASLLNRVVAPGVALTLELRAGEAQVYADPNQLELALLNLLANARDAMPTGGTVTLSTGVENLVGEPVLGSPTPLSGPHVAIAVHDTGTGFDEITRQRMFEPFFTTKPAGQGTGLGLATVLAIAQRAGGGVRVRSSVAAGTTFTLLLPRANPLVSAPEPSDAGRAHAAGATPPLVLLVDDDAGPRETLRRLLQHEGFEVVVAESGAAALAVLDRRGHDLRALVTDYMMPTMSGRELLERVRAEWPTLPALMISGFTPDDGTADVLHRLSVGFLGKPFTGRQLAHAIRHQMALTPELLVSVRQAPTPD